MRTYFDCIPCLLRQTVDTTRIVTRDPALQERILRGALEELARADLMQPPPVQARRIHKLIREQGNHPDPYRDIKSRFNTLALHVADDFRRRIADAPQPFELALRIAIAANIIDFGVGGAVEERQLHDAIEHALAASFDIDDAIHRFEERLRRAGRILYLADNAGEIAFDRLFIEQFSDRHDVTVAVKGGPVINDATLADAEQVGLTERVKVIDNGTDAPGTVLADCGPAFREAFYSADLIISKGQGNFETLSDQPGNIVFLLKAKCPMVARHLGSSIGDIVIRFAGEDAMPGSIHGAAVAAPPDERQQAGYGKTTEKRDNNDYAG